MWPLRWTLDQRDVQTRLQTLLWWQHCKESYIIKIVHWHRGLQNAKWLFGEVAKLWYFKSSRPLRIYIPVYLFIMDIFTEPWILQASQHLDWIPWLWRFTVMQQEWVRSRGQSFSWHSHRVCREPRYLARNFLGRLGEDADERLWKWSHRRSKWLALEKLPGNHFAHLKFPFPEPTSLWMS